MEQENKFLGEGKISKLLVKFSVPCVLSLLISALYNIVDQIFVGNSSLGYLGNAATGIAFPIIIITLAFAWCIGDGTAAYLSICQGRNDAKSAHKCVGSGFVIIVLISIVLMVLGIAFMEPLLKLFGASSDSLPLAKSYLTILLWFFPISMLSNVMSPIIRADGSPIFAMVSMAVGAVINIILDPVFIFALDMGIEGAAWATVIGQVATFILSVWYFIKPKSFKLSFESFKVNFKIFKNSIVLGASSFITQISIVAISLACNAMLYKYGVTSIYGPDIPIAVIGIETKVFTVIINIVVGIVLGGQPILGYNYGARRYDRVRETYKYILIFTLGVAIISTLLIELCPEIIIKIFGSGDNPLYMEYATKTFRIFLSLMTFTCFIKMCSIFFQAVGKPVRAVVSSLVRDIICFIPAVIIIPAIFEAKEAGTGITALLFAAPVADFISMIVALILTATFFIGLKKQEKSEIIKGSVSEQYDGVIKPSSEGVIITIARQHGSQGKQIGKKVAEKLGIPFYYKEMTALAAKESGLDKEFISDINKNSPTIMHDLYLSTVPVQNAILAQDKIIRKIADNGSCVIVGRASDYVLRDYKNTVNVFVYAPNEYRISKVMEMYKDTKEQAEKSIKRSDNARAKYYESISGKKWGEAENYDLCIDSSVGIDTCAEIICQYVNNL